MFGERLTDSHIWRHSLASRQVVDDLVAREEHHCVGVVLERFDNCKGTIDIANVIALPWCRPINTFSSQRGVHIEDHVDANLQNQYKFNCSSEIDSRH